MLFSEFIEGINKRAFGRHYEADRDGRLWREFRELETLYNEDKIATKDEVYDTWIRDYSTDYNIYRDEVLNAWEIDRLRKDWFYRHEVAKIIYGVAGPNKKVVYNRLEWRVGRGGVYTPVEVGGEFIRVVK